MLVDHSNQRNAKSLSQVNRSSFHLIIIKKYFLLESPVFVAKLTTQEVKQRETAVFATKIDGYPTPKVTWLLNSKPLTVKEGAQIVSNAATGDAKLFIPKVDLQQHAGTVICCLENSHGIQEEAVRLDVLAGPLITTQLPKQEETVTEKNVTLRVVVRCSPRPEAEWFYNDAPIAPENTAYDEEKSEYQLFIKDATVAANEGTYRVALKNELGETESTPCVLTVLEPVKLTKIIPATDAVDLKVSEPFEIMADVDGKEAPKVQLTKDGKEVKFTSVEGTRNVYSVTDVKPEHQSVDDGKKKVKKAIFIFLLVRSLYNNKQEHVLINNHGISLETIFE
jgi:hypothetical protein